MWLFLVFFLLNAHEVDMTSQQSIEILGTDLQLEISQQPENQEKNKMTWTCEGECEVQPSVQDRKVLLRISSKAKVKVQAPEKSLSIYLNQGKVTLDTWGADVKARILDGELHTKNTKGNLDISSQNLSSSIDTHRGAMVIDIFKGHLSVTNSSGKLKVSQYSGRQRIHNFQGDLDLRSQQAETEIRGVQGKLTYSGVRAKINLQAFQGEVHGESIEGESILNPLKSSKVFWKANRGSVHLALQAMRGAAIDVATRQGGLDLMAPLKAKKEGAWQVVRTETSASASSSNASSSDLGSVMVRTNTASIRLR